MQAQISQVGATLRRLTVDGQDVIDGFPSDERSTDGRGQVLAPWPNRLTDGWYSYGGHGCQAPLNEPAGTTPSTDWCDGSMVADGARGPRHALVCVRPQPAYEWQLDLEITYSVDAEGLTVGFPAVNADEPAPFGVGFHPYLTLGTAAVDDLD